MTKKFLLVVLTVAFVAVVGAAFLFDTSRGKTGSAVGFISPSDQAQVVRGKGLYLAHCAGCHGASLEGQPDWRQRLSNGRLPAPPHDRNGHTWHHPDAVLFDIVKNGLVPGRTAPEGYESDMPAFGQTLRDADIVAVLAYIKSTWPADVLELQKRVTLEQQQK